MFGRNDFLGEVTLPLAGRIFDDPTPHWYQLQERVFIRNSFAVNSTIIDGNLLNWYVD